MMDVNNISRVYFLGIGGIGMSALARYFVEQGKVVSGYDKTPSPLTQTLESEGMFIHFEDDIELLDKEADLIIYTPAIPKDHKEMNWYLNNGFTLYKRSQVLGLISENSFCMAVAGSHGKTTVSSMIAHILNQDEGCTAFLGGIAGNYNSNYIHTSNKYMVVEADEFDRSFLTLQPNIAVITAIDSDHLEIYGTLENIEKEFIHFTEKMVAEGTLILNDKYKHISPRLRKDIHLAYYGQDDNSDFVLKHYEVRHGLFHFFIEAEGVKLEDLVAHFGGIHNLENATAAIAVCKMLGMHDDDIRAGVLSFKGIKRRFEKHVDEAEYLYYDDYAHHPEEINALLHSLRFLYPEKEIVAVFQPHLFTRTQDLHKEFAAALSKANEVVLLPIYPARELPIEGVTASLIFDNIEGANKQLIEKEQVLETIQTLAKDRVVVTIGAGDIDRFVEPIKQMLLGR